MLKYSFFLSFALFIAASCNNTSNQVSSVLGNYPELKRPAKANVILFWDSECPLCMNYNKEISELEKSFIKDSINFYKVYCNALDINRRKELDENSIFDSTQLLVKTLKGVVTPQAVVLSPNGAILYSGKIDNWIVILGQKRQVVDSFYLKDALLAITNDEEISISKTTPVGCFIEQ